MCAVDIYEDFCRNALVNPGGWQKFFDYDEIDGKPANNQRLALNFRKNLHSYRRKHDAALSEAAGQRIESEYTRKLQTSVIPGPGNETRDPHGVWIVRYGRPIAGTSEGPVL